MNEIIKNMILQEMITHLTDNQYEELNRILVKVLSNYKIEEIKNEESDKTNQNYIDSFLSAKRLEGCSEKSLKYYKSTIEIVLNSIDKSIKNITTNDLRNYLTEYQEKHGSSRVTIDNIRRILSSFFSWLEDEDFIIKSPVRRIHKVKSASVIKETYSDESLELMRDSCDNLRDLALIDILASTGMRVGELVLLNKDDINFNERECVVFGKGDKERVVYFDARTKIHLQNYLDSRNDDNKALFVTLKNLLIAFRLAALKLELERWEEN